MVKTIVGTFAFQAEGENASDHDMEVLAKKVAEFVCSITCNFKVNEDGPKIVSTTLQPSN